MTTVHEYDQRYASIAHAEGMRGALRLLYEAREAGITPSLALALRVQETGIRGDGNVFGHDGTIFVGGYDKLHDVEHHRVTKASYLEYKRQRGKTLMQGVGPLQLTYWTIQDEADRLGGCWVPQYNYRVGFRDLAHLIRMHGGDVRSALAVYNGGAARPNFAYATSVTGHQLFWHRKLT